MEVFVVIEQWSTRSGKEARLKNGISWRLDLRIKWFGLRQPFFPAFLAFTMARCELLPRHNRKTIARIFLYHVAKIVRTSLSMPEFWAQINVMINIFVEPEKDSKRLQHIQIILHHSLIIILTTLKVQLSSELLEQCAQNASHKSMASHHRKPSSIAAKAFKNAQRMTS